MPNNAEAEAVWVLLTRILKSACKNCRLVSTKPPAGAVTNVAQKHVHKHLLTVCLEPGVKGHQCRIRCRLVGVDDFSTDMAEGFTPATALTRRLTETRNAVGKKQKGNSGAFVKSKQESTDSAGMRLWRVEKIGGRPIFSIFQRRMPATRLSSINGRLLFLQPIDQTCQQCDFVLCHQADHQSRINQYEIDVGAW